MAGKSWNRTIIKLAKLGCAVLLLVAPWLFDFASEAVATWNAWLSGCAILAAAARALVAEAKWELETNLALGIWAVIAPSVLGFAGHSAAAMAHVWLGFAVFALAVAEITASSSEPSAESRRSGRGPRKRAAVPFSQFRSDGRRSPAIGRKPRQGR
jgi:SPW repeat-containing protein